MELVLNVCTGYTSVYIYTHSALVGICCAHVQYYARAVPVSQTGGQLPIQMRGELVNSLSCTLAYWCPLERSGARKLRSPGALQLLPTRYAVSTLHQEN